MSPPDDADRLAWFGYDKEPPAPPAFAAPVPSSTFITWNAETATDTLSGLDEQPYVWNFMNGGDGFTHDTSSVTFNLTPNAQYTMSLRVRDALGNMLQSHLAQVAPAPQTLVSVQTYQLAHSLVAKGEGLALVDPFTARAGAKDVQIRPLKPHLDVVLYAMFRPDSPLNPVQKRFLDLVRQLAQRMLAQG